MLKTKSLQSPKSAQDGLRILVMRREKPEYDFDLWIPHLGPSEKLLAAYVIDQKINWNEFKKKYKLEQKSHTKYLKLICQLAQNKNVTLLCWEKSPAQCHRSLIAERCQKMIGYRTKIVVH